MTALQVKTTVITTAAVYLFHQALGLCTVATFAAYIKVSAAVQTAAQHPHRHKYLARFTHRHCSDVILAGCDRDMLWML